MTHLPTTHPKICHHHHHHHHRHHHHQDHHHCLKLRRSPGGNAPRPPRLSSKGSDCIPSNPFPGGSLLRAPYIHQFPSSIIRRCPCRGGKVFQINKNFQILSFLSQKLSPNPLGLKRGPQSKRILGKNIIITTTIIVIIIFMVKAAAGPRLNQYRSSSVMVMTMVGPASQPLPQSTQFR